MKNIILPILMLLVFVSSCSSDKKNHKTQQKIEIKEESVDHSSESSTELQLNEGQRWAANAETTTRVRNMINMVNSFSKNDSSEAYKRLTEELKVEFQMTFKECTMKGEAHNQLHNFLIPINNLFDGLSSSDVLECQNSYNTLASHLKKYDQYFE